MQTAKTKRTSKQWWSEVKRSSERLEDWLRKQYHGEVTAAERVAKFAEEHAPVGSRWRRVLDEIAKQERTHAEWIGALLVARGVAPAVLVKEERYWDATLAGGTDFEHMAGVAAHAERMRLDRITAIADDADAPADIRDAFMRILPQERFHATAFANMAGDKALSETFTAHLAGLDALQLIPEGF